MTDLTGKTIANTYKQLLKVGVSTNTGVSAGLATIETGDGTDSSFQLATGAAKFTGSLVIDGATSIASGLHVDQKVCASAFYGDGSNLSGVTASLATSICVSNALINNTLTVNGDATFNANASVSGNLNIGGTVTVAGAVSLASTLSVGGAANFASTVTVVGAALLKNNTSIGGTLNVAGAGTFTSKTEFNDDVSISGALDVAGNTSIGGTFMATGAATFDNNVSISGGLVVGGTVTIAGANVQAANARVCASAYHGDGSNITNISGPQISGDVSVSNIKAAGNVSVAGTLNVTGTVTIAGTNIKAVNAAVCASSYYGDGSNLTNIAASIVNNRVAGNFAVSANLSVGGTSNLIGAVSLASSLSVVGAANFASTVTVVGAGTFKDDVSVSGNVNIGGTVTIAGAVSLASSLIVGGASRFVSNVSIEGAARVTGTVTIAGAVSLASTLSVGGASNFASTVTVVGAAALKSTVTVGGASNFGSTVTVVGATHLQSTASVGGAATFASTVTVVGAAALKSNVTVGGTLDVAGNTSIGGTFMTTGAATFDNNVSVSGNVNIGGTTTIAGAVSLASTLSVGGAAYFASTVTIAGAAHYQGGVSVAGDITASGTVNVTGDTAAGDDAAIGYTAAEGLILTGQGSTSDLTVKNDADGTVFTVPTGTDDILFPDSAKILVGAGSDLQIYHDGTHSHIDNDTGALFIAADNLQLTNSARTEEYITAAADGAVTLFHNDVTKLATSAAGISVAGDVLLTTGSAGIYLGVTSATAANHLDDYEEGTATLTLTGSTAAPTSAVTVTANYVKIGRIVTIRFAFNNVSTVGATGTVQVTGLPFSAASAGGIGSPMKNAAGSDGLYSVWYCSGTTLQDFYIGNDAGWAAQPITAVSDCSFTNHLVYITAS